MSTRIFLLIVCFDWVAIYAGPVEPLPDGDFYAIRNRPNGWAQLIRIEADGSFEEIAPLWGDDGIPKLAWGYTLAWHPY